MLHLKPGQPLFSIQNLKKAYGDYVVLADITFWIYPGDRIGILGYNGVGKTTLMRILSGQEKEFEGVCAPATSDLKVGIVDQEPRLDPSKTVRENIDDAVKELIDSAGVQFDPKIIKVFLEVMVIHGMLPEGKYQL